MQAKQIRIVILISDCQEDHFLPLINLGESLMGEGLDVTFITCAHGPCPGSTNVFFEVIDYSCVGQRAKINSVLQSRGMKYISMRDGVNDEMVTASSSKLEIPHGYDYENALYRGYNLWDIAKGSICRYLLKTTMSPDDLPVIRRYFSAAILHIDTFPRLFSHLQPDILIIFNGMSLLDRVAREIASNFDIQVFAEENSCFADRKFLDPSGVIINRHMFSRQETWNSIRKHSLNEIQNEKLSRYLDGVYGGRVNTVSQCSATSHAEVFSRLGFSPEQPLALLLGQVPVDSVIVFDSPVYSEMIDFICDVMKVFAQKQEWGLIVRLHPIEERLFGNLTLKRLQECRIPENVRIVHGTQLNTYALMDCSHFAMTINSQSGLEMLSKHKPLIVSGNAFYGKKGFTIDVRSKEELIEAVDRLCENPCLDDAQAKLVDVFLYHFIFEYLIPYDRPHHRFGNQAVEMILHAAHQNIHSVHQPAQELLKVAGGISTAQQVQELCLEGIQKFAASRFEEALSAFKSADALVVSHGVPDERNPLLMKQAEILLAQKRTEEAEEICEMLLGADADEWVYLGLMYAFSQRRHYDIAERMALKCLEMNPANDGYCFELGLIFEKRGKWREAREQYDVIINNNPNDIDLFFHWERSGKKSGACKDLKKRKDILSRMQIVPYICSIFYKVKSGNILEGMKKLYVVCYVIGQRLRSFV